MRIPTWFVIPSLLFVVARTADAECLKWHSNISMCDTNPALCESGAPPPTHGQEVFYYARALTDTPQEACKNHRKFTLGLADPGTITTQQFTANDGTPGVYCYADGQYFTALWYLPWPREAMCERTPNGPYRDLGTRGVDGGRFTDGQKNAIKQVCRKDKFGNMRSDAGPARPPAILNEQHDVLSNNATTWAWQDDLYIPYIWAPDGANVDHIIPRKDKYGCGCGPNSYANMLIVSWQVNNAMSNDSDNPSRQQILQRWTLP